MAANYTTQSNKLKIVELDFDAIKKALREYLSGQDEFKDYDFTGSAMNILLDVLAYNTHYNGFYTNMLASEMFMDSASLRSSIVSLAKHLGYTPSSRRGASVNLDLIFNGVASEKSTIVVPKNAKFTTKIGRDSYTFLTTQARSSSYNALTAQHELRNLEIKEGISLSRSYTFTGKTNETFEIPDENVDTTTLVVAAGGEIYTKADNFTEVSSTSRVYFLQEGNKSRYEIYFGDGVVGKKPNVEDFVQITYSTSQLGVEGNGATNFVLAESISGASSIDVSLSSGYTRSAGGAERESTSSIKLQAPRQFGLQKRLVTLNDYKTRLENDYNLVESVRVWGGEENNPPVYGTVFVSVKPRTGYVLSQAEQQRIADEIVKKRNIVTVNTRFVEPDYLFVIVNSTINFDPRQTSRNASQLETLVKARIQNYNSTQLSKFEDYFRYSTVTKLIDETETSIKNNTTFVAMKKRIRPTLNVRRAYQIEFNNRIYNPHSGHAPVIRSGLFRYGSIEDCFITDRNGDLVIAKSTRGYGAEGMNVISMPEYDLLNERIIESSIGRVDYETGLMLFNLNVSSILNNSEYLYFIATPNVNDIVPQRNTFVTIDSSDIIVDAVDDTNFIRENRVRSY